MLQDGARAVRQTAVARRQAFSSTTSQTVSTTSVVGATLSTTTTTPTTPTTTPAPTTFSGAIPEDNTPGVEILSQDGQTPESYCTVALPSGGVIRFNETIAVRLDNSLSFAAPCHNHSIFNNGPGNSTVVSFDVPFYASIAPQIYTLAATTTISYLLVIILFITPRTFYLGGFRGGSRMGLGSGMGLWDRGLPFMGGNSRGSSAVGIGQRPLLQKIATITVVISLTIATSDTFKVAARQYEQGFMNARDLVNEVIGSNEVKITRVISDAFLWLAQVQTLIRLFPRHKEKVTIKWLGFGLIVCDTIFSILENFVSGSNRTRPASFTDAIPALSYLFELSISLIYASCVVYYSLSKRRFAFWHAKMRNVCLVALMSLIAVVIPVVFFIVDIAQSDIASWGEYIRWVGSAAASVVVWEWVERIEALERDEKKDGILGREIFDGDEMLDMTPSEDGDHRGDGGNMFTSDRKSTALDEKGGTLKNLAVLNIRPRIPFRNRQKRAPTKGDAARRASLNIANGLIARPPQTATPISRSDTNSAASTVYAVRYHNPLSPSPAIPEDEVVPATQPQDIDPIAEVSEESTLTNTITLEGDDSLPKQELPDDSIKVHPHGRQIWHSVANPFKRKRAEPPAEVAAQINESNMRRSPAERTLNLRNKFNAFASSQKERFGGRAKTRTPLQVTVIPSQRRDTRGGSITEAAADVEENGTLTELSPIRNNVPPTESNESSHQKSLPITVIPPPVRGGRTWSPDDLADSPSTSRHGSEGSGSSQSQPGQTDVDLSPARRSVIQIVVPAQTSPGRSTNSPSSKSLLRAPDFSRNRAATATSLSERIGKTSSSTGPGPPGRSSTSSGSTSNSISPQHKRTRSAARHHTPSSPTATAIDQQSTATSPPADTIQLRPSNKQKQKQKQIQQVEDDITTTTTSSSSPASPIPSASGPGRPLTDSNGGGSGGHKGTKEETGEQ